MINFKYILLFALIQLASFVLFLVGVPVCAFLCATGLMYTGHDARGLAHFPKWAWIWDNEEDGTSPLWYNPMHSRWKSFVWTGFRNSVNNLRFVPGVSKVGRPLFYRTWTAFGRLFHIKMGWMSNGYPACSIGGGRGW